MSAETSAGHLRRSTARGAVVSIGGQVANFVLRTGSMILLARLISPKDFGLVGMVTAITGFLSLFKDAGLSLASVQRAVITDAQASTLFWVNLAVGAFLSSACAVMAPAVARFYGDPQLVWITVALGTGFFFSGAVAQHRAMLQRSMRFTAMAAIDLSGLILATLIGLAMALTGYGYPALVAVAVGQPLFVAIATWLVVGWTPGLPQRRSGIGAMLLFGGTVTLNNLIVYIAYNSDKVLLGRYWGAEALGQYGRAYQLINVANECLLATIGLVAFPALSRLQNDPARLKSYFIKGYGLFLSLVIPVTVCCGLFADDVILVMLGPKWHDAAVVFRWLAPTTLAFGLTHPFSWLMLSAGRTIRSLKIALVITPLLICGYALGLSYGPVGVAIGFSVSMGLAVLPVIFWAKEGTLIRASDVLGAVARPAISIAIGAAVALLARSILAEVQPPLLRVMVESGLLVTVYLLSLIFLMKQKALYVDLLRETGLWPTQLQLRARAWMPF
jgi:PST family polysaccharide transporter